jgi:hypothetical protein
MTKYSISLMWSRAEIETVEVMRETNLCVFLPCKPTNRNPKGERKELKAASVSHDTWEEAHLSLTNLAEAKVMSARRSLELANSFAGNVKGMKKP